ncbi:hypothetical protein VO419_004412 [Vibrio parahaemolyticus]|nr:hypothetical protein [Vibrio parahaemolyticus]
MNYQSSLALVEHNKEYLKELIFNAIDIQKREFEHNELELSNSELSELVTDRFIFHSNNIEIIIEQFCEDNEIDIVSVCDLSFSDELETYQSNAINELLNKGGAYKL